jgi:hypothetical protein
MVHINQPDTVIVRSSLCVASDFAEYADHENFFKNRVSEGIPDNYEPNTRKHQYNENSFHDWKKYV